MEKAGNKHHQLQALIKLYSIDQARRTGFYARGAESTQSEPASRKGFTPEKTRAPAPAVRTQQGAEAQ